MSIQTIPGAGSVHTILGSGGVIANSLSHDLLRHRLPVRLVSRRPTPPAPITGLPAIDGTTQESPLLTLFAADLTDPTQTLKAIEGSTVAYLCVGLPYRYSIWRQQWPVIIDNTIEACRKTGTKLIFFDNVYMYGKTKGPMTEETPYAPSSRKGDLRARIATRLMSEVRKGNITAMITRSADFYGPGAGKTGIPDIMIFRKLSQATKPQWLVNAHAPHSLTYIPDISKALYLLATDDNAWNQVWHLPTAASPLSAAELIEKASLAFGKAGNYTVLSKWIIRLAGILDNNAKELYEMLYQYEFDYLFDSSKFENAYHFQPTSYEEGIKATANAYRIGTGF